MSKRGGGCFERGAPTIRIEPIPGDDTLDHDVDPDGTADSERTKFLNTKLPVFLAFGNAGSHDTPASILVSFVITTTAQAPRLT